MYFDGYSSDTNVTLSKKLSKKERLYEAKIWIILLGAGLICIAISLSMHISELKLKYSGTMIEGEVVNDSVARVMDDQGKRILIHLSDGFYTTYQGNTVKLYYTDNIKEAKAMTAMWFWAGNYIFWGILMVISSMFIYKHLVTNRNAFLSLPDK